MSAKRASSHRWLGSLVMWFCVASAAADELPSYQNPYAQKRKAPVSPVHATLVRLVSDKVAACYEVEQQRSLDDAQRNLLHVYGSDVARDLADALVPLGCALEQPVSARCRSGLAALDCARLAEPIVAVGWDRNLTPEAKAELVGYVTLIAGREATCRDIAAEEAKVVLGVRIDRLTVLLESEVVMGKCELVPDRLARCERELEQTSCAQLAKLDEQGQVAHACASVVRCKDMPAQ